VTTKTVNIIIPNATKIYMKRGNPLLYKNLKN